MSIAISDPNKIQSIIFNNYAAINAPNWELIPHKGMQTPSKDELIKQIKDLAAKHENKIVSNDRLDIRV